MIAARAENDWLPIRVDFHLADDCFGLFAWYPMYLLPHTLPQAANVTARRTTTASTIVAPTFLLDWTASSASTPHRNAAYVSRRAVGWVFSGISAFCFFCIYLPSHNVQNLEIN